MFYTYLWLREDGTPYYVGKGVGVRGFISGRHGGLRRPKSNARIFVQYWESEKEAFDMEMWYISLFGRRDIQIGILRNLTDGGEGASGVLQSEESRIKKSLSLLGKSHTPERVRKQREVQLRNPTRGMLGKKHSLESREKISRSLKGRTIWNTGKTWDKATRQKMSESAKRRWRRPNAEDIDSHQQLPQGLPKWV
jgi:hypothetical protein